MTLKNYDLKQFKKDSEKRNLVQNGEYKLTK